MRPTQLFDGRRCLAFEGTPIEIEDRGCVPDWSGPTVSAEDWTYARRSLAERAFAGLRGP